MPISPRSRSRGRCLPTPPCSARSRVKHEKDIFFRTLISSARDKAERAGVEVEVDVRAGHAAELIVRCANDGGFDLVIIGHKGHFLGNYLHGSTADRVAHHATCPVMIVK